MFVVETVVRIRREQAGGKPIKAIARDLKLSRKSVRKAIRAREGAFDYHRTVQPFPRMGPFQERLQTLLIQNEGLPRRDRLRMTRIHALLRGEGFEGSFNKRRLQRERTINLRWLLGALKPSLSCDKGSEHSCPKDFTNDHASDDTAEREPETSGLFLPVTVLIVRHTVLREPRYPVSLRHATSVILATSQ
jgi:hypothetical protein